MGVKDAALRMNYFQQHPHNQLQQKQQQQQQETLQSQPTTFSTNTNGGVVPGSGLLTYNNSQPNLITAGTKTTTTTIATTTIPKNINIDEFINSYNYNSSHNNKNPQSTTTARTLLSPLNTPVNTNQQQYSIKDHHRKFITTKTPLLSNNPYQQQQQQQPAVVRQSPNINNNNNNNSPFRGSAGGDNNNNNNNNNNKEYLTLPPIITDPSDDRQYVFGKLLGKGGFAFCYEGFDKSRGGGECRLAIKVIPKYRLIKPHHYQKVQREIRLQSGIKHKNIVKLYSSFEDQHNIYILLELCALSLVSIVKNRQFLTELETAYYIREILFALDYLHNPQVAILHRDVKLGNVLVTKQMEVKLADFGLATDVDPTTLRPSQLSVCGTPNYISPEILSRKEHSVRSEMWALGCTMYAMLFGRPPFETNSLDETYARISTGHYSIPANAISIRARDLIEKLLAVHPENRLTLREAMDHPFLTNSCPSSSFPIPTRLLPAHAQRQPSQSEIDHLLTEGTFPLSSSPVHQQQSSNTNVCHPTSYSKSSSPLSAAGLLASEREDCHFPSNHHYPTTCSALPPAPPPHHQFPSSKLSSPFTDRIRYETSSQMKRFPVYPQQTEDRPSPPVHQSLILSHHQQHHRQPFANSTPQHQRTTAVSGSAPLAQIETMDPSICRDSPVPPQMSSSCLLTTTTTTTTRPASQQQQQQNQYPSPPPPPHRTKSSSSSTSSSSSASSHSSSLAMTTASSSSSASTSPNHTTTSPSSNKQHNNNNIDHCQNNNGFKNNNLNLPNVSNASPVSSQQQYGQQKSPGQSGGLTRHYQTIFPGSCQRENYNRKPSQETFTGYQTTLPSQFGHHNQAPSSSFYHQKLPQMTTDSDAFITKKTDNNNEDQATGNEDDGGRRGFVGSSGLIRTQLDSIPRIDDDEDDDEVIADDDDMIINAAERNATAPHFPDKSAVPDYNPNNNNSSTVFHHGRKGGDGSQVMMDSGMDATEKQTMHNNNGIGLMSNRVGGGVAGGGGRNRDPSSSSSAAFIHKTTTSSNSSLLAAGRGLTKSHQNLSPFWSSPRPSIPPKADVDDVLNISMDDAADTADDEGDDAKDSKDCQEEIVVDNSSSSSQAPEAALNVRDFLTNVQKILALVVSSNSNSLDRCQPIRFELVKTIDCCSSSRRISTDRTDILRSSDQSAAASQNCHYRRRRQAGIDGKNDEQKQQQHKELEWIVKWIDYTNRFGFGVMLSNGAYTIAFLDGSKLSITCDESKYEFMDPCSSASNNGGSTAFTTNSSNRDDLEANGDSGLGHSEECIQIDDNRNHSAVVFTASNNHNNKQQQPNGRIMTFSASNLNSIPTKVMDRVKAAGHFQNYMKGNLVDGAKRYRRGHQTAAAADQKPSKDTRESMNHQNMPYLVDWKRLDQDEAIFMLLSNGTIQVNFKRGHVKVVISASKIDNGPQQLLRCIYFDPSKQKHSFTLRQITAGGDGMLNQGNNGSISSSYIPLPLKETLGDVHRILANHIVSLSSTSSSFE